MENSIYLLCRENSAYGTQILETVIKEDIQLEGVILQEWNITHKIKKLSYYVKKYGIVTTLFSKIIEILDIIFLNSEGNNERKLIDILISEKIEYYYIPNLNHPSFLELLDEKNLWYCYLEGWGFYRKKLLIRYH